MSFRQMPRPDLDKHREGLQYPRTGGGDYQAF